MMTEVISAATWKIAPFNKPCHIVVPCFLHTSDAADDLPRVDLGGRRIIKKKKKKITFSNSLILSLLLHLSLSLPVSPFHIP